MSKLAIAAIAGAAFVAGFLAAHLPPGAAASEDSGFKAEVIDVPGLTAAAFGETKPGVTPNITYVKTAGASIAVQIGPVPKHFHADSDEIQYVVSGSGTFWLGDREREVHPGDLILIPKGTNHGGSHATDGSFKMIAIKTPPQQPGDAHIVP